jgi:hypothetical protein
MNKRERSLPVRPPCVEKTSRLRSRDPVAMRAAWWHEQQDEVMDGFLVEPQNQGRVGTTWQPSHEWRLGRLHRVRGFSSGSPENHWVPWLIHKAKTEEPKTVLQQCQTGLTGGSDLSDRWVPV